MIDCLITAGSIRTFSLTLGQQRRDECHVMVWQSLPGGMRAGSIYIGNVLVAGCARLHRKNDLCTILEISDTQDDVALLFAAWRKWGDSAPQHLFGEFLLLCWQPDTKQGWVARDAQSYTNWFYHLDAQCFTIATRLPHLFATGVPKDLDEEGLAIWTTVSGTSHTTPFLGIRRLPVGHIVHWSKESLDIQRWWFPEQTPRLRLGSYAAYYSRFRSVFRRVMEDTINLDSAPALLLSGGYDSGAVCVFAADTCKNRQTQLKAYSLQHRYSTLDHDQRIGDETHLAQASAHHIGNTDFKISPSSRQTLVNNLRNAIATYCLPFGNPNNLWIDSIIQQASAEGADLILTGQRGNMTVSWRGQGYFWKPLLAGDWEQVYRVIGRHPKQWQHLLRAQISRLIWRPIKSLLRKEQDFDYVNYSAALLPKSWRDQIIKRPQVLKAHSQFALASRNSETWRRHLTTESFGLVLYHYSIQHQMRAADPTADRQLVEFCYSVPDWVFWAKGKGRGLIREGLAGYLPGAVLNDQLRGLQSSDICARLADEKEAILDCLQNFSSQPLICKWLDIPLLKEIVNQACTDEANWALLSKANLLYRGLILGFFLEQFTRDTSET